MAGSLLGLEKATLQVAGAGLGGPSLHCSFNPKEIKLEAGANWTRTPVPTQRTSRAEYVGTNPRTISMQLFFDEWESIAGNVSDDIDTLLGWTRPTEGSREHPRPPYLRFSWGSANAYEWDVVLKSVSVTFTMFRRDGVPVRATADVSLEEVWSPLAPTNPTSGGVPGQRIHIVAGGDTLHSIAHREYGDPAYWRGLAAINDIDDPLRLRPGTALLIPPAAEAAGLS